MGSNLGEGIGVLVHLGLGSDLVFMTLEFELLVMTPSFILSFRILVLRLEYDGFPRWGTTPCPFPVDTFLSRDLCESLCPPFLIGYRR